MSSKRISTFDNMLEFGLISPHRYYRYCEFMRYKLIEALFWDKTQTNFKLSKYGLCYVTYTNVGVKRKKNVENNSVKIKSSKKKWVEM